MSTRYETVIHAAMSIAYVALCLAVNETVVAIMLATGHALLAWIAGRALARSDKAHLQ